MSGTLHHKGSAAEMCRRRGWGVGTRLIGDEGYGPTVIEITAVGERDILAQAISHAGVKRERQYESSWVLYCREWRVAARDEVPA